MMQEPPARYIFVVPIPHLSELLQIRPRPYRNFYIESLIPTADFRVSVTLIADHQVSHFTLEKMYAICQRSIENN